jgi:hypothetical protein
MEDLVGGVGSGVTVPGPVGMWALGHIEEGRLFVEWIRYREPMITKTIRRRYPCTE